tara:strand:- start:669 stop:902 length:234 start_codon:yes stop_codon:yes gene_type:complete
MPQIGWFEILIIASVAIIVVGPKDFPIIIRKIGSWIGSFKRTLSNIQNEVTEITDIDKENLNNKPKDLKEENKKDNV